jgi:hypothetical protein
VEAVESMKCGLRKERKKVITSGSGLSEACKVVEIEYRMMKQMTNK